MKRIQVQRILLAVLLTASAVFAQQPANPAYATPENGGAPSRPTVTEVVNVTAPGEVRTEQTVSEETLKELAAGTSPIRAVAQLPSVNFTAADPYGTYEWAVRISMRGFNQNQLGFTLDEVPLGDMSYGNWNGLHISRAIMSENIGRIAVSQGTGALEMASNSNLGGTVQFFSLDPSDKRSFSLEQSFGSFNAYRTVGRFESGLLGGHTKFYVTGVSQLSEKWKGHGNIGQDYWQINGKLVHYFGTKGVLTAFVNYSNRHETDYQDLSKAYVKYLGYNWDNYGNWADSIQAAYAYNGYGAYPGKVASMPAEYDQVDAAYYAGAGLRKDILSGVTYRAQLSDKLVWKTTAYGHGNDGIGLWFTPYTPTYNSTFTGIVSPISMRSSEYGIKRGGFLSSVKYESGKNLVEGGVWYEKEDFTLARRYYGTTLAAPNQSLDEFPKNAFYTQWAYDFDTYVYQIHLQDQYKVSDKLTLSAGFKASQTHTNGKLTQFDTPAILGSSAASFAQGELTSGKPFLPQFGANYKFDKRNEIYGDAAYNVRAYVAGGNGFGPAPWGVTQAAFDATKHSIKPETSWTEEVGYRYTSNKLKAQLSYFHVNFSNRLLALQQGPGIAGNASVLVNVGGVTTDGIDAAATVQLPGNFTLYNGFTWNRSTYDDNINTYSGSTPVVLPYKDKTAVDTPEFMWKTQLGYHYKGFFSSLDADYMSKRYYSYDNTGYVDGRFLSNFAAGYNRGEWGPLQDMKLAISIYNLADAQYYSSIGTNGFVNSDPTGAVNTMQVGSPRAFGGSFSVRF